MGGPPRVTLVELGAVAVETIAEGVPEENVAGKQYGAVYNRDMGVRKEDVFGKKDATDRIRTGRWLQDCQP